MSQQEVINHALAAVAAGQFDTVVVVGGEARAWARSGAVEDDEERQPPDEVLTRPPDIVAAIERAAGIVLPPVLQYALIENALGAAEHLSAHEQRDQIAALWARFNAAAAHNPEAAFPEPRGATEIATPGAGQPPTRLSVQPLARQPVDGRPVVRAGDLLGRAGACEAGVPPERWLFPRVALHCSEAVTLTARRRPGARGPPWRCSGRSAEHHIGRPLREMRLAEVYSCFPAAVRVQQRALGLDPTGTPTLTGGMSFAGGPFNHFVLQSMGPLGRRLRDEPEELGLVTTVSGLLSKPGLAVWSASPPVAGRGALLADLAEEARAATEVVPVVDARPSGRRRATVASFTVTYGGARGSSPVRTAIVADLPDGVRTAATCEDAGPPASP